MSAQPIEPLDYQDMEDDVELDPEEVPLAVLMHRARRRPLVIADLMDLDPAVGRTELIDGNLIVTPAPDFRHQKLVHQLQSELNGLLAEHEVEAYAYGSVNIFEPGSNRTLFIPDVVVVNESKIVQIDGQGEGIFPDGILCVIEVTSSNADTDLRIKRDRFLEWKVPYLVVNREETPAKYEVFGEWPQWAEPVLRPAGQ